ncbi:MAG: ATP phosphoribosyltransferase [Candidatus Roizmanbacteria bacterium]|nr:ATP phosphoribosyltransferase [Candidatus Roizmanbacteria bacterium]
MKNLNNGSIKLAIQKNGRLTESTLGLLKSAGLEFENYKKQLFSSCWNFPLNIVYLRDDDIPDYVASGAVDLGIVGENIIIEQRNDVTMQLKLGFGYCSLCLAVPKESPITSSSELNNKKIATSYPQSTKRYLNEKGIEGEIVKINGSVEIAPSLAMADAVIDLVSSGSTLALNDLRVIEKIFDSQAVLIKSNTVSKVKNNIVKKLLIRISGVLAAQNYKYVMMNAPESILKTIQKIVPGLKSPTVSSLSTKGWISIQTVIKEDVFWETIEKLKEVGATGILVLPVEKLIL